MAWNDDELAGRRDELFDRTVRRGAWLQRRRRLAWFGVPPLVLLLVAVPAALGVVGGAGDAGDAKTTVAAGGGLTTAPTTAPTTTATVVAPKIVLPATGQNNRCRGDLVESIEGEFVTCRDQTGRVICSMPLTMSALMCPPDTSQITVSPTTLKRPPPPTTSAKPSAPTTVAAGPTTTVPYCQPGQLVVGQATTDKQFYLHRGEEVLVQAPVVNRSDRPCTDLAGSRSIRVRTAAGAEVWGVSVVSSVAGPLSAIQPGEAFPIWMYWDQRTMNNNQPAAPGTYTATVSLGQAESAPATFALAVS